MFASNPLFVSFAPTFFLWVLTVQTLPAAWGRTGRCPGCLLGGASFPSYIPNNLEESSPLRSAPREYPSCHLSKNGTERN